MQDGRGGTQGGPTKGSIVEIYDNAANIEGYVMARMRHAIAMEIAMTLNEAHLGVPYGPALNEVKAARPEGLAAVVATAQ